MTFRTITEAESHALVDWAEERNKQWDIDEQTINRANAGIIEFGLSDDDWREWADFSTNISLT